MDWRQHSARGRESRRLWCEAPAVQACLQRVWNEKSRALRLRSSAVPLARPTVLSGQTRQTKEDVHLDVRTDPPVVDPDTMRILT